MEITPLHIRATIENSKNKKVSAKKLAQGAKDSGLTGEALKSTLFMIEYFSNPQFKERFAKLVFEMLKK